MIKSRNIYNLLPKVQQTLSVQKVYKDKLQKNKKK
jgi:hypothetical protein